MAFPCGGAILIEARSHYADQVSIARDARHRDAQDLARYLVSLVGKRFDTRGVILHDEVPRVISRLEVAISDEKRRRSCSNRCNTLANAFGIWQWTFATGLAISRHDA